MLVSICCRAPKTVLDFFKPKAAAQGQDKKKRNSSEALHEIQVNGRSPVKRIKAEPGEGPDYRGCLSCMCQASEVN